ncbi:hypothetical protein [Streptomyces sp. CC210A]|uniref:hypothetical protein n=1 Tax=Streptomyces sp. CC210A TaxID=2898184 RepID=UPI001F1E8E22|nr:hypothetical protein [Streptomyces sp. CC210A]
MTVVSRLADVQAQEHAHVFDLEHRAPSQGVDGAGLGSGVVLAHPRYADLPPANCPALRRTGRWPDL